MLCFLSGPFVNFPMKTLTKFMADEIYFVNKFIFFQERNKEDYFYNSLIYIFEHDQNGALGVV